jgi:endonuclease/exonuclease/phosphatase (EEP) superfamily protein YafD
MVSRRGFLKATALCSATAASGCQSLGRIFRRKGVRPGLRTIAYNVYACYGWMPDEAKFKKRRQAAKDKAFMSDMAKRFADALRPFQSDMITFSESPAESVVKEIADRLEMRHAFFPSGGNYPGALMTRLEIIEAANCPIVGGQRPKELFTRHWGRAVLRTPFGETILHSIHLHPSDSAVREREVTEVLKALAGDFKSGRPLLLQGDFNHSPDGPEYRRWKAVGLVDTFKAAGVESATIIPKPASGSPKRIDFVWAYGPLAKCVSKVCILSQRPFCPAPNDPESFSLSDHLPVMATFG